MRNLQTPSGSNVGRTKYKPAVRAIGKVPLLHTYGMLYVSNMVFLPTFCTYGAS